MTLVASSTSAVRTYQRERDQHLAAGRTVPQDVFAMARDGLHTEALTRLRALAAQTASPGLGRFADQIPPLDEHAQTSMRNRALAHIAAEIRDAGPEQLDHYARMGEAWCRTDLGQRIQHLVEDEHTRQLFEVVLMPLPPADNVPHAGPNLPDWLPARVPATYAAVAAQTGAIPAGPVRTDALGFQHWAARQERWDASGQVGDPSDAEYDEWFTWQRDLDTGSYAPGGEPA
jgi:hypothetical protein